MLQKFPVESFETSEKHPLILRVWLVFDVLLVDLFIDLF